MTSVITFVSLKPPDSFPGISSKTFPKAGHELCLWDLLSITCCQAPPFLFHLLQNDVLPLVIWYTVVQAPTCLQVMIPLCPSFDYSISKQENLFSTSLPFSNTTFMGRWPVECILVEIPWTIWQKSANLLGTPLFPWYYLSAGLPYCKQLQEGMKVIFINCLQNCAKTYLTKFATKEFNLPQWKHLHQSWNCPWWYLFHSTYQFLRYVKLQQCYVLKRVMTNMSMIQTTQIQWNRWWAQWQ